MASAETLTTVSHIRWLAAHDAGQRRLNVAVGPCFEVCHCAIVDATRAELWIALGVVDCRGAPPTRYPRVLRQHPTRGASDQKLGPPGTRREAVRAQLERGVVERRLQLEIVHRPSSHRRSPLASAYRAGARSRSVANLRRPVDLQTLKQERDHRGFVL